MAAGVVLACPAPARASDGSVGDLEDLNLASLLDTPTDVWTASKGASPR